ncbi:hypothetical protein ENSA5_16780 [Enhygromyxa salina]|uniref:CobQ/CobB/MinD/ParA nucleotide binding domain-containing protein n=1 Tax=Enhygromyxa salina TaxID=215803 RepID=A0A2S9YE26_9BACT|nr:hypothetical protein [Enhygromyxa salina]PRQ03370.1 hypothetical protein ENSA5_16780 [Enhygromyxa salina]
MSTPPTEAPRGRIATFYSYKGGVGRSMALANVAVILARDYGLKVVAVDWDLEAPGLHRYFGISDGDAGAGVIDYFSNYKDMLTRSPSESMISAQDLDIRRFARTIERFEDGGSIQFISAGEQRDSEQYVDRVSRFDWDDFYRNWNGAQLIEAVRVQLGELGDVVLIDSRTGITDSGGICTLHLPDIIVLVFVFNHQNLDGIARIASEVTGNNPAIDITARSPEALFLPSRKDVSEIAQLRDWEARAVELFAPYFVSSRITERFGDDALKYLRDASVPYVPYFAYGEELAARTDKGYEMTAPLEILAQMISDCAPMPRKVLETDAPQPAKARVPGAPGASRAPGASDTRRLPDARSETWIQPKSGGPMVWGGVAMGALALGVTVFLAVKIDQWTSARDSRINSINKTSSGDPAADTEGEEAGAEEAATPKLFDPQQLRADVRFDYLAFYADAAPPLVDAWQCDLALGTLDTSGDLRNWTTDWQLAPVEAQLRAVSQQPIGVVDPTAASIKSYSYSPFEALATPDQDPLELERAMEIGVQGRVSGSTKTSAWLSTAWGVAESRGIDRQEIERDFRQLHAIADDEDLVVEVTPVIASMQLNYDGASFAALRGWVVRDPRTNQLVVRFIPATTTEAEKPTKPPTGPEAPALITQLLDQRSQHAKWVDKVQGVGTYTEKRNKRTYRINIEGSEEVLSEIRSVRYSFPDSDPKSSDNSGTKWAVSETRSRCEGDVAIEIERTDGVRLPLTFSWCEDAVLAISQTSTPKDSVSGCDGNLIAKNPRAAEKICKQAYDNATSEAERGRLAGQLVDIYGFIGSDDEYCEWVQKAEKAGTSLQTPEAYEAQLRCSGDTPDLPTPDSPSIR